MYSRKHIRHLLLALMFALRASVSLAEGEESTNGVSAMIVPTTMLNQTGSPMRIDVGQLQGDQLSGWMKQVKEYLPSGAPITIAAYVPAGLSTVEADVFRNHLLSQFEPVYQRATIDLIEIDVPDFVSTVQRENELLVDLQNRNVAMTGEELVNAAIAENIESIRSVEKWKKNFGSFVHNLNNPKTNFLIGNYLGKIRGSLGGIMLVSSAGLSWFSAAAGMMDFAVIDATSRAGIAMQDFVNTKLRIPIFKRFPLVRIFNESMFVRSVAFNFTVWNVAYRSIKKGLLHLGNPSGIASPISSAGIAETLSIGGTSAVIGALGGVGISGLAEKGYISKPAQNYLLWSLGIVGQVGHALQIAQHTGTAAWFLGTVWGAYGTIWAASKLLPTRNNRVVVMHPAIDAAQLSHIKKLEGITQTVSSKDMSETELKTLLEKSSQELDLQVRTPSVLENIRSKVRFAMWNVAYTCSLLGAAL
jgi:hypothetical protein